MEYGKLSFEKRRKENIKNYTIRDLFSLELLTTCLTEIVKEYQVDILLTERHGEPVFVLGDFTGFQPDVEKEPGQRLQVAGRTIGHLYMKYQENAQQKQEAAQERVHLLLALLAAWGTDAYMHKEAVDYIDELEFRQSKAEDSPDSTKEDILTGVYNKNYMESRMQVLDRARVAPVAVIHANINDWKFVYDNFGVEKSDSLIQLVASILKKEAQGEYVIGRIDGDGFLVLIPMAEQGEAEDYCRRVQEACHSYNEDEILAPSVAVGIVYKTNVEERLSDKLSDAEYEMFTNKLELKNAPGYQERVRKGLK
ncbi:MAG: GGDEF domain-containing protein [Lachnospiraceae bacterium]|nr:GGDEF domain-containing protein [Lachnospiraceae bacterium]